MPFAANRKNTMYVIYRDAESVIVHWSRMKNRYATATDVIGDVRDPCFAERRMLFTAGQVKYRIEYIPVMIPNEQASSSHVLCALTEV